MKHLQNNMENDFDNQIIERPFTTPEGYFDMLENQIIEKTITKRISIRPLKSSFRIFKYAAAAIITIALITIVVLNNKSEFSLDTKIAHKKPKSDLEFIDRNFANKENRNLKPEILVNDSIDRLVQKKSARNIFIIQPQNPIQKIENKYLLDENQYVNSNTFQLNKTQDGQNQNTPQPPISPLYTQHTSDGNGFPTSNGADIARISNAHLEKLICLPSDTCSVFPVTLLPIEDKNQALNYYYLWSTGESSPAITISNSGLYTLKLYSKARKILVDSCQIKFNRIPYPEPDLGQDQTICSHESILLTANTKDANYTYSWSIGTSKSDKLFLNRMKAGDNVIKVNVNACGTVVSDEVIIHVKECILQFSNVISPNGDGKNDYFIIDGLENYPGSQFVVMDRNGKVVFETMNYQNNWSGDNLPEGTYFYFLKLKDGNGTEKAGSVTIMR
jgi:gliding motility-associated-like protein